MKIAAWVVVSAAIGIAVGFACGKDKKKSHDPSATEDARDGRPISYFFDAKEELPECDAAITGSLAYIKAESTFYHCTEGLWTLVDVTGPKGETGAKGDAGATGSAGQKGDKGAAGDAGTAGTGGGLWVYDADARRLGILSNWGTTPGIYFTNGGHAYFSAAGTYAAMDCYIGGSRTTCAPPTVCQHTTSDCSGVCYIQNAPAKNAIVPGSSNWYRGSGNEVQTTVNTLAAYTGGSCVSSPSASFLSYPITESYSFPTGVSYPFTGPLYIAP